MNKKYSHVLMTTTKNGHVFITNNEHEKLRSLPLSGTFETSDGIFVKGVAIMEILPISEFYRRFPDQRPEKRELFVAPPREEYESLEEIAAKDKRKTMLLLKGLKRYRSDHPGAKNVAELYGKKAELYKKKWDLTLESNADRV
jgi:hypothetical protein